MAMTTARPVLRRAFAVLMVMVGGHLAATSDCRQVRSAVVDHLDALAVSPGTTEVFSMARIPTEYDFDQIMAEAVTRIGRPKVAAYLEKVAKTVGWPIPPADRFRVAAGLALLIQGMEKPDV